VSIWVLAGTNGAGKSSLLGELIAKAGRKHFNPDEFARSLRSAVPGISVEDANSAAWKQMVALLDRAIRHNENYAFETTLGGRSIPTALAEAAVSGVQVHVWYVALESADLHIARVRSRAAAGGHDIPEAKIRERYETSRSNLLRLLLRLTSLKVYDNSLDRDPARGETPDPRLLLEMVGGRVVGSAHERPPRWARTIVRTARLCEWTLGRWWLGRLWNRWWPTAQLVAVRSRR
jgi:predicted ABC-type ATPase